jgi:transcriptional regulator with XRE-family HTH domain
VKKPQLENPERNIRLSRLRETLGLNQSQMAERLGITREWLSQLETGKAEVQELTHYKMQELEKSLYKREPQEGVVRESQAPFGTQDTLTAKLKEEARRTLEDALSKAGDEPVTVSWILTQLRIHLTSVLGSVDSRSLRNALAHGAPAQKENARVSAAIKRAEQSEFTTHGHVEQQSEAAPPDIRSVGEGR